jgi:hypothetical protein
MKVSTENDNNFGYEKITILVDNIPLSFPNAEEEYKCQHVTTLSKKYRIIAYLAQITCEKCLKIPNG